MGLDMYLDSFPKIDGMALEDILVADGDLENITDEKILKHVTNKGTYFTWKSISRNHGY